MSNTIRNSIILALLLLAIVSSGYFLINVRKTDRLADLNRTKVEKGKEYDDLSILANQHEMLLDSLNVLNKRFFERDKLLMPAEDSKITFEYINYLASLSDKDYNFTFLTGNNEEKGDYLVTNYLLDGEASFNSLYSFLWRIENASLCRETGSPKA